MRRGASWLIAAGLCAALTGCTDDEISMDAGDGSGSGTGSAMDASDQSAQDSGPRVWVPPDAGTRDSGTSSGTLDSGLAGRTCAQRRDLLPAQVLPRCSADTAQCIADCMTAPDTDACRDACIQADTTPADSNLNCGACIYLQLFACIDATDCHDGVAELFCCIEDKCPAGSPEGCTEQQCGSELMTAITCGYFANQDCVDFAADPIALCFEDGSADGGT